MEFYWFWGQLIDDFYDNENQNIANKNFIDDDDNQQGTLVSFYRRFDDQTCDIFEA